MTNTILSLTSNAPVAYPIDAQPAIVCAGDGLNHQEPSEQTLRIANRLLGSLKAGETIIGCTGIRRPDPSASFVLHTALAMLHLGHGPVLVVDGNFTRSNLPAQADRSGLVATDLLAVVNDVVESIEHTSVEGLDILPLGTSLRRPSQMQTLFDSVRQYKLVLVDIGPVLCSTESLILAAKMDAIVAVGSSGELTQREAVQLKSELSPLPSRFLGLVLTDKK
jgi:Mrp family chromosome partitioning ATPase